MRSSTLISAGSRALTGYERKTRGQPEAGPIVWGQVTNGLQLGIAPPVGTNGAAEPMFDGTALRARVFCRNAGDSPARLLASVHTCLLGQGGQNAVLVSEIILTPRNGGVPLAVTYQGWNHLTLLDKRRAKGEQPQTTLNRSFGGTTDIELSPEDAKRMTTALAPGETGTVAQIHFTPGQKPKSWWWLQKDSDTVAPGFYAVTALFRVGHPLSEWKGVLRSGSLEVEIQAQRAERAE